MLRFAAAILVLVAMPALAQSRLVLPVEGPWYALGGPPCEDCAPNVANALRLTPVDPFGRLAPSCINRPVVSPTDGTVTAVGTDATYGHHIAIQRSDTEAMVLGFLLEGSVTVAPGDAVSAGEAIARCGGPTLHVHMQASRDILAAQAKGLPMRFSDLDVRTPGGCQATPLLYRGQGTC